MNRLLQVVTWIFNMSFVCKINYTGTIFFSNILISYPLWMTYTSPALVFRHLGVTDEFIIMVLYHQEKQERNTKFDTCCGQYLSMAISDQSAGNLFSKTKISLSHWFWHSRTEKKTGTTTLARMTGGNSQYLISNKMYLFFLVVGTFKLNFHGKIYEINYIWIQRVMNLHCPSERQTQ